MPPCTVPARVAMMRTPTAQRETMSVIRSQSGSHIASRCFGSTLASALFRSSTSHRKKRQMNVIRKTSTKAANVEPANPTRPPSASGTAFAIDSAPDCTLPAALVSPTESSSLDVRSFATRSGRSLRKSCSDCRSGIARTSRRRTATASAPRTVTVAAPPRPSRVLACTSRTGRSKTSPRKTPTATTSSVSRIVMTAQVKKNNPTSRSNVRKLTLICSERPRVMG